MCEIATCHSLPKSTASEIFPSQSLEFSATLSRWAYVVRSSTPNWTSLQLHIYNRQNPCRYHFGYTAIDVANLIYKYDLPWHCFLHIKIGKALEVEELTALYHCSIGFNQLKRSNKSGDQYTVISTPLVLSNLMDVFLSFFCGIQLLQCCHHCPEILVLEVVSMGNMGHAPCLVQENFRVLTTACWRKWK